MHARVSEVFYFQKSYGREDDVEDGYFGLTVTEDFLHARCHPQNFRCLLPLDLNNQCSLVIPVLQVAQVELPEVTHK